MSGAHHGGESNFKLLDLPLGHLWAISAISGTSLDSARVLEKHLDI